MGQILNSSGSKQTPHEDTFSHQSLSGFCELEARRSLWISRYLYWNSFVKSTLYQTKQIFLPQCFRNETRIRIKFFLKIHFCLKHKSINIVRNDFTATHSSVCPFVVTEDRSQEMITHKRWGQGRRGNTFLCLQQFSLRCGRYMVILQLFLRRCSKLTRPWLITISLANI